MKIVRQSNASATLNIQ